MWPIYLFFSFAVSGWCSFDTSGNRVVWLLSWWSLWSSFTPSEGRIESDGVIWWVLSCLWWQTVCTDKAVRGRLDWFEDAGWSRAGKIRLWGGGSPGYLQRWHEEVHRALPGRQVIREDPPVEHFWLARCDLAQFQGSAGAPSVLYSRALWWIIIILW